VWLRAFAARGGYDPARDDALPWLYGIARNVLREHWRAS
jgi:DNA-directed RNA polymerase specialized sigma24 family protein